MNPPESPRNRIVVGITGHRTIDRPDLVIAGLESALCAIERAFRVKSLMLLSPLAEGADQLAAQTILKRPGGSLTAVLPLKPELYIADFLIPAAKLEFNSLLAQAEQVIQLDTGQGREIAYLAVGEYIVSHCDVLIAIWDDQPSRGPGGTGDIVRLARRQQRPLIWFNPEDEAESIGALNFENFPLQADKPSSTKNSERPVT